MVCRVAIAAVLVMIATRSMGPIWLVQSSSRLPERGRGPVWKMGTFRDRFLAAFGAAGPLTLTDLTQPSGCHSVMTTIWLP
jgi:hypothetical protein